jgi:hypothetical protein
VRCVLSTTRVNIRHTTPKHSSVLHWGHLVSPNWNRTQTVDSFCASPLYDFPEQRSRRGASRWALDRHERARCRAVYYAAHPTKVEHPNVKKAPLPCTRRTCGESRGGGLLCVSARGDCSLVMAALAMSPRHARSTTCGPRNTVARTQVAAPTMRLPPEGAGCGVQGSSMDRQCSTKAQLTWKEGHAN